MRILTGRIGTAGIGVPFAVAKIDIIRNNFRAAALIALFVGPAADLQPAGYHRHAALGEILGDEFSSLTPGDTVDEIGFPIAAVLGSGIAVASFTLAVDRDFSPKDGGERECDFVDCVAWRQTGEFVSKYFTKGCMAVVSGRLQIRSWNDKDGNKRRTAEIVADNVYFGGSRRDGADNNVGSTAHSPYAPQGGQSYGGGSNYTPPNNYGNGGHTPPSNYGDFAAPAGFEELGDDDLEVRLPF